ncbi:hypothetical protein MKK50_18205 [Methylobacterium sp. J-043]|nr:hypothetical protein [Methylobacterium sp. J-043]
MPLYTIPLNGRPERFQITLQGVTYTLRLIFNDADEGGWTLDIADAAGTPILCGTPLLPAQNLLAQHQHLDIGGTGAGLYVKTLDGEPPGFSNLADASLIFVKGGSDADFA